MNQHQNHWNAFNALFFSLLKTTKTKISKNNAYNIVDPGGDFVHIKQN
jgi:hypothetical protein